MRLRKLLDLRGKLFFFFSGEWEEGINQEVPTCEMKQSCSKEEPGTSLKAEVPRMALYSRLSDTSA